MAPAADLWASVERPEPPASLPAAVGAVWAQRPSVLLPGPQVSVVQPAFPAAYLCLLLPLLSLDYMFERTPVTQKRGFNHIDQTSVNAHSAFF